MDIQTVEVALWFVLGGGALSLLAYTFYLAFTSPVVRKPKQKKEDKDF